MFSLFMIELVVRDFEKSLIWYRDYFQMAIEMIDEVNRFVLFQGEGTKLSLRGGKSQAGSTRIVFQVESLEPILDRLAKQGIYPIGPIKESAEGYRGIWFQDPDQHRVGVFEWL